MNKLKFLILLILIVQPVLMLEAMQKTTTRMATSTGAQINRKIAPKLNKDALKMYKKQAGEKIYKTYSDVFYHPLYTHWFEPLYVGNKAEIWGHQFAHFYQNPYEPYNNFTAKRAHTKFHKMIYQSWKDRLTPQELFQHQDVIQAYEDAYHRYLVTPTDPDHKKELIHQTERIYQTLHDHPASKTIEPAEIFLEY